MRRLFVLAWILSCLVGGISVVDAETAIIGFIAQDTTWTQANSPYVTLGSIIVKEGVTLTIEPGVTIQFDLGHSLTIEGTLIARGTDKQGIKFTPKGVQKPGAWGGILFEDSSIDAKFDDAGNYLNGSILQYCTVEFAITAVKANSASPFIDHCVISDNAGGGISISEGDIVVILNSTIADNKGGGIYVVTGGIVTVSNNILAQNIAEGVLSGCGGGIYVSGIYVKGGNVKGGNITIDYNTLTENTAKGSDDGSGVGGGIYVSGSSATISNNTLTENTAKGGDDGSGDGGGIYVSSGTATINNNTLTGNTAKGSGDGSGDGGGIYVSSGTATISNNTLTGNTAKGGDGFAHGGGIYVSGGGSATISNNTLTGNTAQGGGKYVRYGGVGYGGGICVSGGSATISNNTLTGNTAGGSSSRGGGIYTTGGPVTISNNTLTGNTAKGGRYGDGGGICVSSGTATISNNTLTGNTAKNGGGGIYAWGGTITSNTITENCSSDGAAIYYSGSQDITDNIIANNVAEETGNTNAVYINGNPAFTGNAIIGNQTKFNLYYAQSKGSPNLDATNNYWGVTTEAEIRVKIYDFFADNTKAFVDVVPFLLENPLPMGSLTITVSPKALPADGKSTAIITATLKDSRGKPEVDEPLTMVVSQGTGKLSEVKNNKDGTYTATYTASRTVGSEIIWVAAPKSRLAKSIEIQLTEPGVLPPKTLNIPDTEAAAGGTVDIPVEIDDITGVAKAEIDLGYDAKFLEMQDVSGTDLIKGLTLTKAVLAGKIFLEGAKGLAGGSGAMFHVTFKIAKDAPVGETEIKFEKIALFDEAGKEIPSIGTNGKLNVKAYQPPPEYPRWDVNQDGVVDISDLVLVGIHFGEDYRNIPAIAAQGDGGLLTNPAIHVKLEANGKVDAWRTLQVDVIAEDAIDLYGYQLSLIFDPKALMFIGATPGSLLEQDGHSTYWIVSGIDNKTGYIQEIIQVRKAVKKGVSASGTLATITFAVKNVSVAGSTLLGLVNVAMADSTACKVKVVTCELKLHWERLLIPQRPGLLQNYPNPFNPETWIPYCLSQTADVTIRIYDLKGQLVRVFHIGSQPSGWYVNKTRATYWNGRNENGEQVASGVYFYQLQADTFSDIRKLLVVR